MIYVIGSANDWENNPIKIGFTGDESAKKRLGSIQTGNPTPLAVIHEMEGSEEEEKLFHSTLDLYRLNGEWFDAGKIPPCIRSEIVKSTSAKESLSRITLATIGILDDIEMIVESKKSTLDFVSTISMVESLIAARLTDSIARCRALEIVLAAERASIEAFSKSILSAMGSEGQSVLSTENQLTEIRTTYYTTVFSLSAGTTALSMQASVVANLLKSSPELLSIVVQKIKGKE